VEPYPWSYLNCTSNATRLYHTLSEANEQHEMPFFLQNLWKDSSDEIFGSVDEITLTGGFGDHLLVHINW